MLWPEALPVFLRVDESLDHFGVVGLDEQNQAVERLERAVQERSQFTIYLDTDPRFDRLSTDPRFQDLLKRIGV